MTFSADQLSEISSIANDYLYDELPNIITSANYAYEEMTKPENLLYVDGGDQIKIPIVYQENQSQGFINGRTGIISNNPSQQITHALLDWKYFYTNVPITLDDLTRAGKTAQAIERLVEVKIKIAVSSMQRQLGIAVHGSGTAANNAWNGFTDIFAASGTAYAGLLDTDATNWLTEIDSSTTIPNYEGINSMLGKLEEKAQLAGEQGMYPVKYMVSRQRCIDSFKSFEQIKQRYADKDHIKSGAKGISINGVFWYADANAAGTAATSDNYIYYIAPDTIKLAYTYGFGGHKCPLDNSQTLANQPIQINVNYLAGNIVCVNRRANGVQKTINA